jgi:hypothetical protein
MKEEHLTKTQEKKKKGNPGNEKLLKNTVESHSNRLEQVKDRIFRT